MARRWSELAAAAWSKALERVVLPADHLELLEKTQWSTPDEIASLQLAKLRALLAYAGEHVPYYRELFAKVGFSPRDVRRREDIACLPPLTREIVRERYDDLIAPEHRGRNVRNATSGATGAPLAFEYSRESEAWREAIQVRAYGWAGYAVGRPSFHYWGATQRRERAARWRSELAHAVRRDLIVDPLKQDERSMLAAARALARRKARVIVAYTQAGAQWARFILDRGLRAWSDIPVICGAEAVLSADRAALERAFGPVFETYGSRETALIAAECCAHEGMHVAEENLLVEITRRGAPLPDGETGEVLVTDLNDFGMPFIRYANGDLAAMRSSLSACACARGLRRLDHVDGRRADTLVGADGSPIPGLLFHVVMSEAPPNVVKQFQVRQRASGGVVLRVVRGNEWDDAHFARIVKRCREYLGALPLAVELVPWIPVPANGKWRTVIVERPGRAHAA